MKPLEEGRPIRALVVEDEPPARRGFVSWLEMEDDVEVVGESGNGSEALALIEELRPDVAFLDIQMPGLSGIELARALDGKASTKIVFVTAHESFAIEAFDLEAVDYLLKPFSRERLATCLEKIRRSMQLESRKADDQAPAYPDRIVARSGTSLRLIPTDSILWIESARNYVYIHLENESLLSRETLSKLEESLDPERFMRVHRSRLVNLGTVTEISRCRGGELELQLKDGSKISASRAYRDALLRFIEREEP